MATSTLSNANRHIKRGGKALLATCIILAVTAPVSQAQSKQKNKPHIQPNQSKVVWAAPTRHRTVSRPGNIVIRPGIAAPRRRTVNNRVVYRRYGPPIYGYGFHYSDVEAVRWLAFTHISLSLMDRLEEQQVRYYEQAQIDATSAPIGEAIIWNEGGASGSTTAIREGSDLNGHVCREFQQTITVGGDTEEAYGTACLTGDGTWKIMS